MRTGLPNPLGFCMCGCGQKTGVARQSDTARGTVRGEHVRYVSGHNAQTKEAREFLRSIRLGPLNPNWLGDTAGYSALHVWLNTNHPRSGRCEDCGLGRHTEYALISEEYTRNRADYRELCRSCHVKLDANLRHRGAEGKWVAA